MHQEHADLFKALLQAKLKDSDIARLTRGILFLGSPHEGSSLSIIGQLIACTGYWRGATTTLYQFLLRDNLQNLILDETFRSAFVPVGKDQKPSRHSPYVVDFREGRQEKRFGLYLGRVQSSLYWIASTIKAKSP
jgi:hypothetical protein